MAFHLHDVLLQDPMVNRHVMFYEAEAFQCLVQDYVNFPGDIPSEQ